MSSYLAKDPDDSGLSMRREGEREGGMCGLVLYPSIVEYSAVSSCIQRWVAECVTQ